MITHKEEITWLTNTSSNILRDASQYNPGVNIYELTRTLRSGTRTREHGVSKPPECHR